MTSSSHLSDVYCLELLTLVVTPMSKQRTLVTNVTQLTRLHGLVVKSAVMVNSCGFKRLVDEAVK